MLKLNVSKREKNEKPEDIRAEGVIPAVLYGPKVAPQSIKIVYADFEKAFKEAGESTIVTLVVDGEEHDTLIHDVDFHPVKGTISHVDFYVVEKGKKVSVNVALEFEGIAPAEKTLGGTLTKVMHEVEIEALPKNLPHDLKVDISVLVDFESQIHASDIKLPEGVELLTDPEEVIALVQEPREEEPDEPAEAVDINSIEVSDAKGKKEEDKDED